MRITCNILSRIKPVYFVEIYANAKKKSVSKSPTYDQCSFDCYESYLFS